MKKRKIAVFESKGWEKSYVNKKLSGFEIIFFPDVLTEKHISKIKNCELISIFIYSKITAEILKKLPNLRHIATRSTGFDHINLSACKKFNVNVSNVPYYGENTVAEHTFALILSLSRNVHKAYVRTIQGNFSLQGLQGMDLKGKTLGVIGAGRIGMHVIKMAKGFGMHVLAFDLHHDTFLSDILHYNYVSINNLLANSDIITLHAPYNKHTHHMINKKNISKIKKGALIINTARGALIETDALIQALDKGILGGAGLDVLEGEELFIKYDNFLSKTHSPDQLQSLFKNQNLLHRDNVVITPHLAFDSKEAIMRILDTSIKNIKGYFAETDTPNVVRIV